MRKGKAYGFFLLLCLMTLTTGPPASGAEQGLLPEGTAVILYYESAGTVSALVMPCDSAPIPFSLEVTVQEVSSLVREWQTALRSVPAGGWDPLREVGARLYEALLSPLSPLLEGKQHLVIVPSGVIFGLSFAGLFSPADGCPLIEHYTLSYLPSLGFLREAIRGLAGGIRGRTLYAAPCGCSGTDCLPGKLATESAVKDAIADPSVQVLYLLSTIHLSANSPLSSWTELASAEGEDGRLTLAEILERSCNLTALGIAGIAACGVEEAPTLGIVTSLLLSWGLSSLLLPSMEIPVDVGEQFLQVVGENLQQGLSIAEAVRQAQLDCFSNPRLSPFLSFVLYGAWGGGDAEPPPETGKLGYSLFQMLQTWRGRSEPDEPPPTVTVQVDFFSPVDEALLSKIKGLSDEIRITGAMGNFALVELPLSLVDALAELEEVKFIALPLDSFPG